MNMDGLLLHGGQWAACVNPEEKWVLRIADLGRAPNRFRRARQKGPGKPVLMSGDGLWGGGCPDAALGGESGDNGWEKEWRTPKELFKK